MSMSSAIGSCLQEAPHSPILLAGEEASKAASDPCLDCANRVSLTRMLPKGTSRSRHRECDLSGPAVGRLRK